MPERSEATGKRAADLACADDADLHVYTSTSKGDLASDGSKASGLDHHYPLPAVPYLKLAAVRQEGGLSLFALNRSLDRALAVDVTAKGFADLALEQALELRGNLEAVNSKDDPDRISRRPWTASRSRATACARPSRPHPGT